MIKILNVLKATVNAGLKHPMPEPTSKKILLSNQLALFFATLCAFFTVVHFFLGTYQLLPFDLYFIMSCLSVPLLNQLGFIFLSRLSFIAHFTSLLAIFSCLLGRDQHVHLSLNTVALTGLVLFEAKDRIAVIYSIVLPIVVLLILEFTDFKILQPLLGVNYVEGGPVILSDIAGMLGTFAVAFYFFRGMNALVDKLSRSQHGFAEAQKLAKTGSWDLDCKEKTFMCSAEFRNITDSTNRQFSFRKFLRQLKADDREAVLKCFKRLMTSESSFSFEVRLYQLDQSFRNLLIQAKSNSGESSLIENIHGTIQDVTELREAQRTIEDQRVKMITASKMSSLGEMAGGMAHEINTPLGVILLHATQLQRLSNAPTIDPLSLRKKSANIEHMVQHISRLIKGLQSFARGGDRDPFQATTLSSVISDAMDLATSRFSFHQVQVKIENVPPDLIFDCRSTQIIQVLTNLLNNAFDAINQLEERWIRIEYVDLGESFQLVITDSGAGIPNEIQEKVMQPFFTTKPVGKGTGLGLSISRGIIEAHSGSLVINTKSPNTQFIIILPKSQISNLKAIA